MYVLIVDPESNTISDLKAILEKLRHNVVAVASTGEEAIKIAENLNPDLILINIKLKGEMSGLEAAKEMGTIKIPIIFLTDFYKNCLNKSLQLQEDTIILSKPINQDHLEYCIKRAIREQI